MFPNRSNPAALLLVLALTSACNDPVEQPPTSENWQRVDASGHILSPGESGAHHCVFDPASGLMWQVHGSSGGLHDAGNRYSWYSPDKQQNMSEPGLEDGGRCEASPCDTQGLVAVVNERQLCGHSGWRLPSRAELFSLGDLALRDAGLIVDAAFFPEATAGEYWTAETFRLYPDSAWAVDFGNGLDRADFKSEAKSVRLVRRHAPPTETE